MPTHYRYLRCGDLRSPGVTERRNGPLGLRDDDDDDEYISRIQGVSKSSWPSLTRYNFDKGGSIFIIFHC